MPQYPVSPRQDVLDFCQDHVDVFQSNSAALGLAAGQLTSFKAAVLAYNTAAVAQRKAKDAAKAATVTADDTFIAMRRSLADVVRTIKAFAENSANPSAVYVLAQIAPPSPATPAAPPAQPTDVAIELNASTGAIVLKWKAENPTGTSGTSYIIRRRLPGQTEFAFVGVSGKKTFTDSTFIAGPDSVQYTIQGQRADAAGPVSPVLTVTFGRAPVGSIPTVASVKMAA